MKFTDLKEVSVFDSTKEAFFMIDIETDGLEPTQNSITSFCITHFCGDGILIDKLHLRIWERYENRSTCPKTIQWRWENKVTDFEASLQALTASGAIFSMCNFIRGQSEDKDPIIFANHTEFDIAFLKGYLAIEMQKVPWKHDNVYDMGSMIKVLGKDKRELRDEVLKSSNWATIMDEHFNGEEQPHNAFYDCCLQTEVLLKAFEPCYGNEPF